MHNIYLVGLPGTGKTYWALKIAEFFNLQLIDTDKEIERETQKNINEIFENLGEKYFRKLEEKKIHEISKLDNYIVSTGGGLPTFNDNMKIMLMTGLVIYIKSPIEKIAERISNNRNRPAFYQLNREEIISKLSTLAIERRATYEQSHFIFESEKENSWAELIKYIKTQQEKWSNSND